MQNYQKLHYEEKISKIHDEKLHVRNFLTQPNEI